MAADAVGPAGPSSAPSGRLTAGLAVAACAGFPLLELGGIAIDPPPGVLLPAVLATACYLPLFLWIVIAALRGHRPRGGWWAVGGIAVVLAVAVPVIGAQALPIFPALAVGAMLLVRPAVALAVLLALAAGTAPLALAFAGSVDGFWYVTEVLWLYALVALVGAVRRLEQARRDLADQALARERLRIYDELRRTVGVALADLAARGGRIVGSPGDGRTPAELAELVAASRHALAQARRIARSYQRPALRAELDAAVALLGAAGIPARVEFPDGELSAAAEEVVRRDLQAATARLLLDGSAGAVVLCVAPEGSRAGPGVGAGGSRAGPSSDAEGSRAGPSVGADGSRAGPGVGTEPGTHRLTVLPDRAGRASAHERVQVPR